MPVARTLEEHIYIHFSTQSQGPPFRATGRRLSVNAYWKGGFNNVSLYLDTYLQHIWGFMFKKAGSGGTTVKSLTNIFHNFAPSETFMTDGGPHFKCEEVENFCARWGTKTHIVAAYSPWVNGLVEGTNKLLLYILARLCAPEIGEDRWNNTNWEDLPQSWTDNFDQAIRILNWCILPSLKFSLKELLLGLVVNMVNTPLEASASLLPPQDINVHFAYAAQQQLDGYSEAVQHMVHCKAVFDRKVINSQGGQVTFTKGQLVQVYRSDLTHTLSMERKIVPMWSPPQWVTTTMGHLMAHKLLHLGNAGWQAIQWEIQCTVTT